MDLDRRSFLKAGAVGTTGLALDTNAGLLQSAEKPWNAATARSLRKYRDPAPTICRMCPAHCGILAYRDGDRVVQIQGAAGAPTNQGSICSRAFAGLERVYDAERQLFPLRRKGSRGGGEWEPTTWEEALAEIAKKLGPAGRRAVLHLGQDEILVEELRSTFGWRHVLVDRPLPGRPGPASAARWYGAPVLVPDASRARTVFLFGERVLDDRFLVPLAKGIVKAQGEGASVHLFDSLEGATGSASRWHPVAPGTEAVVAWGIARLILKWGAYDATDLARRVSDPPEVLFERLAAYTPETVESVAGIPASQLVYLARRFAEGRPALGLARPSSPAAPAAALLNHLAGSVNVPGGVPTARGPFFTAPLEPTASPEAWLSRLADGEEQADLYWVVDANPAYDAPNSARVRDRLADPDRVGTLVVMDTHLTETAQLADWFLPLATHFESWSLVEGVLADGRSYLFLQQPVTRPASEPDKLRDPATKQPDLFRPWARPLGDARSLPDVFLYLLQKEFAVLAPVEDSRSYLGEILRKSWGPGSLEALEARGIWVSEEGRGRSTPVPVSLLDSIPAPPGAEDSLLLLGYAPASLPRSFANNRRGREIHHRFEALMHEQTARSRGIADGQLITLRTASGEIRAPVRLIQGLHPRAVAVPDGFGHWGGGTVARAAPAGSQPREPKTYSRRELLRGTGQAQVPPQPGEPIWWDHEGPGESLRSLYPFQLGVDGLQTWAPIPVEVGKA